MNAQFKNPSYISLFFLLVILQFGCTTDEWIPLFDGKTLDGWEPSENKDSWQIIDGAIVTKGPKSHLFYMGDVADHNFKNFEFSADVKTEPNSNSGIFFHTTYQETDWPKKGYECQVINSTYEIDEGGYIERKMTGSLYGFRNLTKSPAQNGEWFNYRIVVQGKAIRAYINDELMTDYTEPENPYRTEGNEGRILSSGTFALQCHDPNSTAYYKNIKVKLIPDDLPSPGQLVDDLEFEKRVINQLAKNNPLMDLHSHLKGGLTEAQILEHGRSYGISYGIAFNCGIKMGFETEDSLSNFLATYERPKQAYIAMQAEGREWVDLFSSETIDQFDYVFTDAMTWTNDNGKRMRLWIKEETEIGDPQDFMDQLTDRIVGIVSNEPIDIYVNATYLPDEISADYDTLWTEERMDKVINALVENKVAMEISARYKIPSIRFVKRAKAAGVKFTYGTNNSGADDLGRLEYCIGVAEACDLSSNDFWYPNKLSKE